ncbi:hypothetical protein OHS33_38865 (plasmid) [Streptomyces sp. NBC_00536]|uniref:hypothetical protein n=1 Tax=Streptomyces sp. NBC_00536 TaxID=2975769 RepID=UPI002E8216C9|nr:hypothetical protein [Streptomyces sp. NBC_00536]WUC84320.1 hypothetical protein OHS33_38865 [Streptomyces sp. NBC_00536]
MSPRRQLYWKGFRVPFVAPWSEEKSRPGRIVRREGVGGQGIGYEDEHPIDRRDGVLWVRTSATPGWGRPELAGVHALRQRQAIAHMLCQVCGESTIGCRGSDERHLFLLAAKDGEPIQENETTLSPPIHVSCALESVQHCRHLQRGHTAALVEHCPLWGVAGIEYDAKTIRPIEGDELTFVSYTEEARLRWTLAARTVISLHGCTTVDLSKLAAETVPA